MSFMQTVPAQEKALDYLREQICRRVQEKLIVCGHSKGGNLAVYSAANCSEWMQDRITAVYNNDGPGFLFKPGSADGYRRIADRIHLILPENSLVGILLEQVGNYKVVSSSAAGANQHDGMTWQVYGTEFPAVKSLTSSSFKTRQTLHSRLYAMNENQRRGLISGLFDVARKAQTFTLTDMYANRGKITRILMDRLKNMDAVQKDEMLRLVRLLVMGQGVENGRSLSVRTHKSSENP